jgi:acyl-CoA synthetase (NDP forming)
MTISHARSNPLDRFFRPSSIVLVGASDKSRWARMAKKNLEALGFEGKLHVVNRRGGEVLGQAAAVSCVAIGEPVDVALLLIPAAGLLDALEDLAAAKIKYAVVLSSGFAETGADGRALQDELRDRANAHGITILGPNCLGFANFAAKASIWTGTLRLPAIPGDIGIVSQSGAVANSMGHFAYQQGVGLSCIISTGNEVNFGVAPGIDYLIDDPATKVICVFMESVRDPFAFKKAAARAFAHKKPLIALKVGRSEITAKAAQAHTGALVGDDKVFDALCGQSGIIRVRSIEELVVTADVMAKAGALGGVGVGLVSISGGLCEISADLADLEAVELPTFGADTSARLKQILPDFGTAHNPLDLTGAATEQTAMMRDAIKAISADSSISLLCYLFEVPTGQDDTTGFSLASLESIGQGVAEATSPVIVLSSMMKTVSESGRGLIAKDRLPYVSGGLELGMPAISRAIRWWEKQRKASGQREVEAAAVTAQPRALPNSEYEAQRYLAEFDVPVIPTILARTAQEAADAARKLGERVVIKIASEDIAHKSDIGGVMLDLAPDEVGAAFDRMMARVKARSPAAKLDGVLVSTMRKGGVELLVGVTRDAEWGLVLAVGLGGVFVEVLKDTSLRLLPVNEGQVVEMLSELRGAKLLAGYRNTPATDLQRLASVIARIGDAALALGPSLQTLEVNPLVASGDRIEALDALVVGVEQA